MNAREVDHFESIPEYFVSLSSFQVFTSNNLAVVAVRLIFVQGIDALFEDLAINLIKWQIKYAIQTSLIGEALMQALCILYCLHAFKRSVILRLLCRQFYRTNQETWKKCECLTGLKISTTPANYV